GHPASARELFHIDLGTKLVVRGQAQTTAPVITPRIVPRIVKPDDTLARIRVAPCFQRFDVNLVPTGYTCSRPASRLHAALCVRPELGLVPRDADDAACRLQQAPECSRVRGPYVLADQVGGAEGFAHPKSRASSIVGRIGARNAVFDRRLVVDLDRELFIG